METPKIFDSELRFCEILWSHEPIKSSELVRLCAEELGWKKSTTYTVLKKLCDRGIFQNEDGIVTPLVSRQEFHARQSQRFVEETFQGSMPAFIAAFSRSKKLTRDEVEQLKALIDNYEEDRT